MPAVIFSGNNVKALKSAIQLAENSTITSGSVDPSSIATAGVAGDVYISTSTKLIYVKQDSGTTTNWNSPLFSDGANFNYNPGTQTLTISNLTVNGTTTNIETTNVNVSDKLVILNKNGAAASGNNVGFEVEENNIITGYIQTSADRNSWELKAPNTAGVATITPGTGGIDLSGTGNGTLITGNLEVDNTTSGNVALIVKASPGAAVPANLLFDAEYSNGGSLDATYVSTGSATPTATVGSPVVISNRLALTANTGQYVEYSPAAAGLATQTGCIRFRYKPNYTGAPPSGKTFYIVALVDVGGSPRKNSIEIFQLDDGRLFASFTDTTGTTGLDLQFAYSPVSGVEDEFELNWDVSIGATRLFLNGSQVASSGTTFTKSVSTQGLYLGFDPNDAGSSVSNFSITDLVIYSAVQHTSNFSSPVPALGLGGGGGQSADLQDWTDNAGTVLTSINNVGFLTLVGNPTTALMAATKQYVDSAFAAETLTQVLTNGNNAGAIAITNLSSLEDASSVVAIDIPGRTLYDSSSNESVLWENRILYDPSTIVAVDWNNRSLMDSGNFTSIDWQSHQLHDTSGVPSEDYTARQLIATDGSTPMLDWSGASLSANTHKITNVVNPTSAQDAATKSYVDGKILALTSNPSVGGAVSEALTVPGLLTTDTILSVTQRTMGAATRTSLAFIGWDTVVTGGLTAQWVADPGPGAVLIVAVKR